MDNTQQNTRLFGYPNPTFWNSHLTRPYSNPTFYYPIYSIPDFFLPVPPLVWILKSVFCKIIFIFSLSNDCLLVLQISYSVQSIYLLFHGQRISRWLHIHVSHHYKSTGVLEIKNIYWRWFGNLCWWFYIDTTWKLEKQSKIRRQWFWWQSI